MSGTVGQLREQIGRMEAMLTSIVERVTEMRADAKEATEASNKHRELIWSELRTVKHENRNELHTVSLRMDKLETLLGTLQRTVDGMQRPLQFAVNLHKRLGTIALILAAVGWALWEMKEMIWDVVMLVARALFPGKS